MPIYECDPWRTQYFTRVDCPPDVHIPTDDTDAHRFNPGHRWIYNKLLVAKSQGLECGLPGETPPSRYPVFCKPVTNLKGMGAGSCVLFDYWMIQARARPPLIKYSQDWIREFLPDYTGMLNIETIGGRIIEAHLRFSDQWPDLYGREWLDSVVRLYRHHYWNFADRERSDGYSVVLFGPHGRTYQHPTPKRLSAYRASPGISSVQITFFEDRPQHEHVMPPGGFRLAVINGFNLEAGMRLRATMLRDFGLPEQECLERLAV